MQINIDTEILETILVYSTTAERLADYIHNTVAANAVHQISHIVSRLLSKSSGSEPAEQPTPEDETEFNVAIGVDQLHQLVAKADALVKAAEDLFERVVWVKLAGDSRQLEQLAHLIGAASEAVGEAVEVGDRLAVALVRASS